MVSVSLGLMKSSINWAGIVMGARLFIPKVVFAFLFSLPRIIIFIFVSSAACAFWSFSSFIITTHGLRINKVFVSAGRI
ncbi:hypothetical protein J3E69DRAFT_339321 [Trichoderma sp. SZMC 28015]